MCLCLLAMNNGAVGACPFICLDVFRGLIGTLYWDVNTGLQGWGRCRGWGFRLLGGASRFFLVQLGGHFAPCFLISCLPCPHEWGSDFGGCWYSSQGWTKVVLYLLQQCQTGLRGLRLGEGRGIHLSGLVWGPPPTHCIIIVAFLFVAVCDSFGLNFESKVDAESLGACGGKIQ